MHAHFEPRLIDGGVVGVLKERMNEVKKISPGNFIHIRGERVSL